MTILEALYSSDGGSAVAAELSSDGEKYTLFCLSEDYAEIKGSLKKGPIDDELLETIRGLDSRCRALRKGRSLLEFGCNSRNGLILKLRKRGFSGESAEFAADRLMSEKIINEDRDALREAERMVSSGFGRKRIISSLYTKGYGREAVSSVYEKLDEYDFSEICRDVIIKKWRKFPEDPDTGKRAIAALMRLGFSSSEIRSGIKKSMK
ncbi:MAG: RecX family transcriptional regulator [Clostridia bacterium]|nr:RecX family transcriptional regulator [Clostridia bacterium]